MQDMITDWWTKITTMEPKCVYYFGPFSSYDEAKVSYRGYIEDLDHEGAKGIIVIIERCEPDILTIYDEAAES